MRKATSKIEKITQKSYMDIWLRSSPRLRMLLDILEMATLIGVGLLFPSPRISSWWIKIIGIILTSTGIWLHKLSHSIHKQAHLPKEEIKALVTNGIYSKIRHPCYLEIILYYFGLFLLIGSLGMLILISVFMYILYDSIIKEEKYLKKRFGKEYEGYVKRVPWRFIPKLF